MAYMTSFEASSLMLRLNCSVLKLLPSGQSMVVISRRGMVGFQTSPDPKPVGIPNREHPSTPMMISWGPRCFCVLLFVY